MSRLFPFLTNLLFPPRCLFCRSLQPGHTICPGCEAALPRTKALFPLENSVCAAPFYYEGAVRLLVHRFKFEGKHALASPMSAYVAEAAQSLPAADLVTWVPVSRRRYRVRGYDQSWLLARETAARLWLPVAETLRKPRDVPSQSKLTDQASRRKNVSDAFAEIPGAVEGRRILLIDDVFTSGATLEECVGLLLQAGAASVVCAVFAKTRRPSPS